MDSALCVIYRNSTLGTSLEFALADRAGAGANRRRQRHTLKQLQEKRRQRQGQRKERSMDKDWNRDG